MVWEERVLHPEGSSVNHDWLTCVPPLACLQTVSAKTAQLTPFPTKEVALLGSPFTALLKLAIPAIACHLCSHTQSPPQEPSGLITTVSVLPVNNARNASVVLTTQNCESHGMVEMDSWQTFLPSASAGGPASESSPKSKLLMTRG